VTRIALALFQGLARQRQIDPGAVPADLFALGMEWLLAGLRPDPGGRSTTVSYLSIRN
jgi:hypothetical protein